MWGSLGSFDRLTSPVEGKPPPALMNGRGKPERGTFCGIFLGAPNIRSKLVAEPFRATDEKFI
jgi:hypothetical protein